jgi:hypothetical protein
MSQEADEQAPTDTPAAVLRAHIDAADVSRAVIARLHENLHERKGGATPTLRLPTLQ